MRQFQCVPTTSGVTAYVIAWVYQTHSMAPSLFTMLVFSFVKKYTNKCLSKLSHAGGALHHNCAEDITATPRNTVAFVVIHPQISKRETVKITLVSLASSLFLTSNKENKHSLHVGAL